MKELKDLQVGDEVVIYGGFQHTIGAIQKITKTQITVNGVKFRRDTGMRISSDRWNTQQLCVPTEADVAKIKADEHRRKLQYFIANYDFKKLSIEKLEQVYNIIKTENNG